MFQCLCCIVVFLIHLLSPVMNAGEVRCLHEKAGNIKMSFKKVHIYFGISAWKIRCVII